MSARASLRRAETSVSKRDATHHSFPCYSVYYTIFVPTTWFCLLRLLCCAALCLGAMLNQSHRTRLSLLQPFSVSLGKTRLGPTILFPRNNLVTPAVPCNNIVVDCFIHRANGPIGCFVIAVRSKSSTPPIRFLCSTESGTTLATLACQVHG